MTKILSVLKIVRIHQRVKYQTISSRCSPENVQKSQIWPVLLCQNVPKLGKSTDCDHNLMTTSEGGHDTSTCKISGHSFMCSPPEKWECLKIPNFINFIKFFGLCDPEISQMTLKIFTLLHPTRWMFSLNFMKLELKPYDLLLQDLLIVMEIHR